MRVEAAALNRLDLFVRDGIPGVPSRFRTCRAPTAAGVVEALGAGRQGPAARARASSSSPGSRAARASSAAPASRASASRFRILGEHLPGTFAEKVAVPAANVLPGAGRLTPEQAAAFPLAALTAWRMLVTRAALRPGETVLIHGIGGGVSTFALQIAKLCGASRVIVTSSSEEKRARAKELGADDVIDYTKTDVGKAVRELTKKRGVDVVVDSVGAATWKHSLTAAAKRGAS